MKIRTTSRESLTYANFTNAIFTTAIFRNIPELFGLCNFLANSFTNANSLANSLITAIYWGNSFTNAIWSLKAAAAVRKDTRFAEWGSQGSEAGSSTNNALIKEGKKGKIR